MESTICKLCRRTLQQSIRARHAHHRPNAAQSTASLTRPSRTQPSPPTNTTDLAALLVDPTWSVRTLLPSASSSPSTPTGLEPETLHHLLRLSALPQPATEAEQTRMLSTLSSQLHFVRSIQSVKTAGVSPLRVIRDESENGLHEQTIGLGDLRSALGREDIVGHAKRPRRPSARAIQSSEDAAASHRSFEHPREARVQRGGWDVLDSASETAGGRFFVVRSAGSPE
ncbi:hypothetical protein GGR57DRAFT_355666 [Xylariaceae sp. FL1272]|nr:hypothetical protein GGR57DRAFT_355666 [Xylariaceae sp. FL1272]